MGKRKQKNPDDRPQSTADLRRRLEACSIALWDSASATTWWREHQSELDRDAARVTEDGRTIAVDGSPRAAIDGAT